MRGCPNGCLRLRVWEATNTSNVVYDNERGKAPYTDPTTPVQLGTLDIYNAGVKASGLGTDTDSEVTIVGSPPYVTLLQLLGDIKRQAALYLPAVER